MKNMLEYARELSKQYFIAHKYCFNNMDDAKKEITLIIYL